MNPYTRKDGATVSGHTKNIPVKETPPANKKLYKDAISSVAGDENEKFSVDDITFALDPRTSRWAQHGFTYGSNWEVWEFCGVSPNDAIPFCVPPSIEINSSIHSSENPNTLTFLSFMDTSNVEEFGFMFWNLKINIPVNEWNTKRASSMRDVFHRATHFNQPLDKWDTSATKIMRNMFRCALSFNQPLDKWDTGNVREMTNMFEYAGSFDQDLSSWNIAGVEQMKNIFTKSGMSPRNLTSTFSGWLTQVEKNHAPEGLDVGELPCRFEDLPLKGQKVIETLRVEHGWKFSFAENPTRDRIRHHNELQEGKAV